MNEEYFWSALEYRLCREFSGLRQKGGRMLWCDGFCPGVYLLDAKQPRIEGRAFIGDDVHLGEWHFTLFLPNRIGPDQEIRWETLLPPDNVTYWLAYDEDRRRLQIEPGAAKPDGELGAAESKDN